MKKSISIITALLSSAVMTVSAIPFCSFAEEHITGDINGDGIVNSDDFDLVLQYYTESVTGNVILDENMRENVLKYGDMNGDGNIDAVDASFVCDIALKTLDVNGDGEINIDDAMYIHDFAMNIESHSPEEIENLTKLTANVKYFPDAEYLKPELIKYSLNLAKNVTGLKSGDVNGDGNVNSMDASEVLSLYSDSSNGMAIDKNSDEYKYITLLGDMDGNGVINSSDASEILYIYARIATGHEY